MNDKNIEILFKYLEKVIRFIIPGFITILLIKIYLPSFYYVTFNNLKLLEMTIILLFLGIVIYIVHRVLYEIFDIILALILFDSVIDSYIEYIKIDKKIKKWLEYHFSIIHSALILSEIGIIVSIFSEKKKIKYWSLLFFLFIFLISIIIYIVYFNISKKVRNNKESSTNII